MNVHQSNCNLSYQAPAQIPVQFLLELEANLLGQNVNELEFELTCVTLKKIPTVVLL